MPVFTQNFTLDYGADFSFTTQPYIVNGAVQSFVGAAARCQLRIQDSDPNPDLSLTQVGTSSGSIVPNGILGTATLTITKAAVLGLRPGQLYQYSVFVDQAAGNSIALLLGTMVIGPNPTQLPVQISTVFAVTNFTPVTAAQSPYTALTSDTDFLVDCSAGPVTIQLLVPAASGGTGPSIFTVKDQFGQSATHPITIKAPTGWTIENPSSPGTYGSQGTISQAGAPDVAFKAYGAGLKFVEVV